jgi:hypothetical protein
MEEFPRYAVSMTLEEEVIALRAEVARLKEQLAPALAVIAQLRKELDRYKSESPPAVWYPFSSCRPGR